MPTKPANLPAILAAAGVESQLELLLLNRLERAGLPTGMPRQQIIPGRKFEFDRVWPAQRVAVEVQGGVHARMGHSTGVGIERDCEKLSLAAAHGWRCLPLTEKQIKSGLAVALIAKALGVTL
jgi:very-short-patch-repair endonuclease